MSFEVEVKFRVPDPSALIDRLRTMGVESGPDVRCVDLYFAHPSRDFALSDEALRLRCEGDVNRITYKGPKRGGPTKTRQEIEIPYSNGDASREQMETLLKNLGFAPVAVIAKTRRSFDVTIEDRSLTVVLDEADGLGTFAEVETLADGEPELAEAQRAVLGLAKSLDLTEVEPRSYLRMHLEQRSAPGHSA
jgi:adenylate cyclase class 2